MKTRTFYESLGRFMLEVTLSDAKTCSHAGDCEDDVKALLKKAYIAKQFKKIGVSDIRDSLAEYGAWSDEELKNTTKNQERMLWIACCDIVEETKRLKGERKWKN